MLSLKKQVTLSKWRYRATTTKLRIIGLVNGTPLGTSAVHNYLEICPLGAITMSREISNSTWTSSLTMLISKMHTTPKVSCRPLKKWRTR